MVIYGKKAQGRGPFEARPVRQISRPAQIIE